MRLSLVAAMWAVWLPGGPAVAHAFLKSASPATGSTIHDIPSEVRITFTESVEPLFSKIVVTNASGIHVESGAAHAAGNPAQLAVALRPLLPGSYLVQWHATSVDTHKTQGSFSFTLLP